jgi:hypothetical protein
MGTTAVRVIEEHRNASTPDARTPERLSNCPPLLSWRGEAIREGLPLLLAVSTAAVIAVAPLSARELTLMFAAQCLTAVVAVAHWFAGARPRSS